MRSRRRFKVAQKMIHFVVFFDNEWYHLLSSNINGLCVTVFLTFPSSLLNLLRLPRTITFRIFIV